MIIQIVLNEILNFLLKTIYCVIWYNILYWVLISSTRYNIFCQIEFLSFRGLSAGLSMLGYQCWALSARLSVLSLALGSRQQAFSSSQCQALSAEPSTGLSALSLVLGSQHWVWCWALSAEPCAGLSVLSLALGRVRHNHWMWHFSKNLAGTKWKRHRNENIICLVLGHTICAWPTTRCAYERLCSAPAPCVANNMAWGLGVVSWHEDNMSCTYWRRKGKG